MRPVHLLRLFLIFGLLSQSGLLLAAPVVITPPQPAVKAALASRSLLLDIAYSSGVAIAVGERGHVLVACGDCSEWHQANVPVRANLTAVHMHDDKTAWAVGHDAVILKTGDGGENWEIQYRDPKQQRPFLDVWFKDALKGYAIGAYGLFMMTEDGGKNWQQRYISEDDFHLNQMTYSESRGFYIAAEAGMIYHSVDGEEWELLDSPYEGSFFDIQTLPDNSLLLAGLRGHLFHSQDGQNWSEVNTGTEVLLTSIKALNSGAIVITGMAGVVLHSVDGMSFRVIQKADRKGIAAVAELPDGGLLAVGEGGIRRLQLD